MTALSTPEDSATKTMRLVSGVVVVYCGYGCTSFYRWGRGVGCWMRCSAGGSVAVRGIIRSTVGVMALLGVHVEGFVHRGVNA